MPRRQWSDLPPDLVREISCRLHVAADLVCLHAVCKAWHDSRTTKTNRFFRPWLLDPAEIPLTLRCVFSKSSYRVPRPPPPRSRRNWVASADGTALWYLTVYVLLPILHDPLTGAITHLPPFPYYVDSQLEKNSCGIVYGDGTILLYSISYGNVIVPFRAALLRPGDTRWTLVDRNIHTAGRHGEICAAYHGVWILVTLGASLWLVNTLDSSDDVLVPRPCMPGEQVNRTEDCSYVLESQGELLWASVQARWSYIYRYGIGDRRVRSLSVSVHALEMDVLAPQKARWVRKEGCSLADRVLFLGSPHSFTVDASQLGNEVGCAYFVYYNSKATMRPLEEFGVFCYNFLDSKATCVERSRPRLWDDNKVMWLIPQPTVAPVQDQKINETRQVEAPNLKKHQTALINQPAHIIHMERQYEHSFRVLVRNLPLKVKGSELHRFFSKHGKVSSTEIIYYKKTKTSQGIGFVTMATMHVHKDDALAALNGLILDGCRLEVIVVNDGQRRRRRAELIREQSRFKQLYPGRG